MTDNPALPYRILFVDTETTGLPLRGKPNTHPDQPHITELGAILDVQGREALVIDTLILPENWPFRKDKFGQPTDRLIDPKASEITGITEEKCFEYGLPIADAVETYMIAAANADFIVAHNVAFDGPQMEMEYARLQPHHPSISVHCGKPLFCTMKALTPVCKIPKKDQRNPSGNNWKWPKLEEAWFYFFGTPMEKAHSAIHDIRNTRTIFYECLRLGLFKAELAKIDEMLAATPTA